MYLAQSYQLINDTIIRVMYPHIAFMVINAIMRLRPTTPAGRAEEPRYSLPN